MFDRKLGNNSGQGWYIVGYGFYLAIGYNFSPTVLLSTFSTCADSFQWKKMMPALMMTSDRKDEGEKFDDDPSARSLIVK